MLSGKKYKFELIEQEMSKVITELQEDGENQFERSHYFDSEGTLIYEGNETLLIQFIYQDKDMKDLKCIGNLIERKKSDGKIVSKLITFSYKKSISLRCEIAVLQFFCRIKNELNYIDKGDKRDIDDLSVYEWIWSGLEDWYESVVSEESFYNLVNKKYKSLLNTLSN